MSSLDEIFSGEVEEVIEPAEVVDEVIEEADPTGETDQEEPEKVEDTPPVSEDKQEVDQNSQLKAQIAKAQDEKNKRQELQRQLEAIQRQQQENQESPDPYAEPDKAISYAVSQAELRFQDKLLNMSEMNAKGRHSDDFDQMKDIFFDKILLENPSLRDEALSQVDPYEYIYRTAKNHVELSELNEAGGVEGYRAKLETELRAKWEAEQLEKSKLEIEKKINDSIPNSLATQRAAGGNQSKVFEGDQPLSKIVKR